MVVDGQISFLPLFCSSDNISDKSIVKIEEKVAGIDKRLSNEETISRTALGAIAGDTVLAVASCC
jgi:hypothetical protein